MNGRCRVASWMPALLRIALGGGFFYAGVVKLGDVRRFAGSVASFRLLPDAWIPWVASGLPFFEALAGFWLFMGWRSRVPALALLLLTAGFMVILTQALIRGLDVNCGCFGGVAFWSEAPGWLLGRDLVLLLMAGQVYRAACRSGRDVARTSVYFEDSD